MHLTSKERILLYLLEHTSRADAPELPRTLTREDVARAASVAVRHLSQYVRPLVREGLVRERQEHVKGIRQRRKVYDLTEAGRRAALKVRQSIGSETVRVSDGSEVREATVGQTFEALGGKVPMSRLVLQVLDGGIIDLEALRTVERSSFVEVLTDAPRIEGFTGRREEVQAIVEGAGRPQIYVIQGVAGIGKSSLAAKVCEVERGKRNIFWHKVRSWDTDQTLFAGLADFFRALDRPALASVMTRGDAGRAAEILREDLPGTQSVLVFDDVHEASRGVLSFLALLKDAIVDAPDVQVLVLTRRRVSFYDPRDTALTGIVREINLGGLDPGDVAALFAEREAPPELLRASRRLRGHPLLCQLLITEGGKAIPSSLPLDVHRFIEEHVYPGLTPEERTAMKILSLFVVPVPRTAVVSHPRTTREAFDALVTRFLIRPVGDDTFELHDTIRESFLDALSSSEGRRLGAHVLTELERLASTARKQADFAACVGHLSNALGLSSSPMKQAALEEELGDASARLGDLAGALIAFRSSAKTARNPDALVRLHRKSAEALFDHGDFRASEKEADAALRILGQGESVDRGWLDLLRCRIAIEREEWDEAETSGKEALRTFTSFARVDGQARAFLQLGRVDFLRGRPDIVESANLEAALRLATQLGDPLLLANVHLAMADLASARFGDPDRAMTHFAAIEGIPTALADPAFACRFFVTRGWTRTAFLDDQPGAIADCTESLRLAQRLHDEASIEQARSGMATALLIGARFAEAEAAYSEAAASLRDRGLPLAEANARWLQAECSLFDGDVVGFRRTLAMVDRLAEAEARERSHSDWPRMMGPGVDMAFHGLDELLKGHSERAVRAFHDAVRAAEERSERGVLMGDVDLPSILVWYGMALRAMGDPAKGDELLSRGVEVFHARHLEGAAALFGSDRLRPFQQFLRRSWLEATRGQGAAPTVGASPAAPVPDRSSTS